jgi:tetratricopeptide (TPR) repeat protein
MSSFLPFVFAPLLVLAQDAQPPTPQKLFESGQYDQLLARVADDDAATPEAIYLSAQAALKLEPPDREAAKAANRRLEQRAEHAPAWPFIARSAIALVDHQADEGLAQATLAVAAAPEQMFAHYQLGLAHAEKRAWAASAAAFEKAIALGPTFAYAHYYAGMTYYQVKRVDKMAAAFDHFLKLAPQAPERQAVQALMRTLRGR